MSKLNASLFSYFTKALYFCVGIASFVFYPLSVLFSKRRVRILCYHRVCDLPETGDSQRSLNVAPAVFDRQMAFLSRNGFNIITLDQLVEFKRKNEKPPPKVVVITLDDGYRDNYLNAFPIMGKYNFKGTFFVVTDYINGDSIFHWLKLGKASLVDAEQNKQYWLPLNEDDIRSMSASGSCFGSHTKYHCNLSAVAKESAIEELRGSRERLCRPSAIMGHKQGH